MKSGFSIVVCGSVVPDPLQSLEPVLGEAVPSLKNEMMLPNVLDPWAAHALYEAANIAKKYTDVTVYLVSIGPKMKLQQLMMTVAQKVPFKFVAIDGSASGFIESDVVAEKLTEAISGIPEIDVNNMFLFGGMSSATRDAGITIQQVAARLGLSELFYGVDELEFVDDLKFRVKERLEDGTYLISESCSTSVAISWATGSLPEPINNPQQGMLNMREIMPALQKAAKADLQNSTLKYVDVAIPSQKRETRIEKDMSAADIAKELAEWIKA